MTGLRAVIGVVATALALSSCAIMGEAEPDRDITSEATDLPTAEVDIESLPQSFQELPLWSLPYDDVPTHLDGVLFGLQERRGVLEFSAVSTDGQLLWTTQRPPTCSGFALTMVDDQPLAILTDVTSSDDALSQVTASAFDLHTGEPVWGPVEVVGPWHGPGAVFAQGAPPSTMGDVGQKQVLDPLTGKQVDIAGTIIGEFDGTILSLTPDEDTIRAQGAHTWQKEISDMGWDEPPTDVSVLAGQRQLPGHALISGDDQEASVIRVSDGTVVTTGVSSAVWDASVELIITTEEGPTLAAHDSDGPVWNRGLDDGLQVVSSGGVLSYLRGENAVQVVNSLTGEDAVAYSPDSTEYAIPRLITPDGAGVFTLGEFVLAGSYRD